MSARPARNQRLQRVGPRTTIVADVRRLIPALLALTVCLPATVLARTQFRCDVDLIVRDACCCPPKKAKPPVRTPTMQRECCKLVRHSTTTPPVASERTDRPQPAPAAQVVALVPLAVPAAAVRVAITARAQAPPSPRTLLSQHCALLV